MMNNEIMNVASSIVKFKSWVMTEEGYYIMNVSLFNAFCIYLLLLHYNINTIQYNTICIFHIYDFIFNHIGILFFHS